jgi:hypothetical protein
VLTDLAGWRSVFLVNVPIGLAVLLVLHRVAPGTRTPGAARPSTVGSALLIAVIGAAHRSARGLLLATPTGPVTQLTYAAAAVVGALSVVAAMVAGRSAPVRDASPDAVRG